MSKKRKGLKYDVFRFIKEHNIDVNNSSVKDIYDNLLADAFFGKNEDTVRRAVSEYRAYLSGNNNVTAVHVSEPAKTIKIAFPCNEVKVNDIIVNNHINISHDEAPSFKRQEGMHIMLGCNHVPFHDVKLHKGIYRLIKNHKHLVKGFHLMGDFMDLNSLSSHDKGRFTAVPGLTLDSEYLEGNIQLDYFDEVLPDGVWKTYLYGNHEDRWNRWMSGMDNAKTPLVSPLEALKLLDRGYQVKTNWSQDFFTLGKDFDIFHGIYFSIHCAKAHIDKLKRKCAFVHTHRQQFYREGSLMAYNIGTCADIDAPAFGYASRPMKAQWGKGFAINMIDSEGNSNVTMITPDENSNFWFGGIKY